MTPHLVWVNGRLEKSEAPHLPVTDRSFQLGDGVFETLRVSEGNVLELSLHLERLRSSAEALEISLPDALEDELPRAIRELLSSNGLGSADAAVRVTASRGSFDGRVILPPAGLRANVVLQAWRIEPPPPELLRTGLSLAVSDVRRDPSSPLARVKTTSRAELVYARIQARRRGADDALLLTTDGFLAEATSASIFLASAGELLTPSLNCGILESTTRRWVISSGAAELGLGVREDRLRPEVLLEAEEAFLASSVAGILPVTRVDGQSIGSGTPGPRTLQLRTSRERYAHEQQRSPHEQ